jgi:hypothetical protein
MAIPFGIDCLVSYYAPALHSAERWLLKAGHMSLCAVCTTITEFGKAVLPISPCCAISLLDWSLSCDPVFSPFEMLFDKIPDIVVTIVKIIEIV